MTGPHTVMYGSEAVLKTQLKRDSKNEQTNEQRRSDQEGDTERRFVKYSDDAASKQ